MKTPAPGKKTSSLRKKAERALKKQTGRVEELSKQDMKHLITELGTHQIELEMQNEELRTAQEELEASRSKYADLYDFAPIGYFTLDSKGVILETNLTGADLLGVNKRLLLNKSLSRFIIKEEEHKIFIDHLAVTLEKQTKTVCEVRLRKIDGTEFHAQLQSIAVDDAKRRPLVRTAIIDITDRKRAESALEKAYDKLHATLESITDGFFSFDREWRFTYVNETASTLLRKKKEELVGRIVWDVFPKARQLLFYSESNRAITEGMPVHFEEFYPDPLNIWYECHCFPSRDGLSVYFQDITERKRVEEALKTAHAELARRAYELEAVNSELEAFSFTIANDLKAPLRSIEGFSRAILEDYAPLLDDTGKDYFKRIQSASHRMSQLIDAMYTMARTTHGELRENNVDLSLLATAITDKFRKQDPRRPVDVIIADWLKTRGDPEMLAVALENLLDNAWKFTSKHDSPRIEFGVIKSQASSFKSQVSKASNSEPRTLNSELVYFVKDNGAGFDQRYAHKLFQPFHRLHSDEEFPGIGIGLAITNAIIKRHGGRMWAEGEPGKGATFFFTL